MLTSISNHIKEDFRLFIIFILTSLIVLLSYLYSVASDILLDESSPKEIILIVNVDTLRCDKLGVYGNRRNLTPNLDKLAKEGGVVFDYAYAASNHTRPSVASLLTGLYPTNHGFWNQFSKAKKVDPNISTILPKSYKTFLINANPNTFNIFKDYFDYTWSSYPDKDSLYKDSGYYPAEFMFKIASESLQNNNFPDKVFMYIQPADPHSPYYPLDEYPDLFKEDTLKNKITGKRGTELAAITWDRNLYKITDAEKKNMINRYDAEIRYLDNHLYMFLKFISEKYSKVLFLFTSDHGESFLDHNDAGHGTSLYNEQIRIPFIIIDTQKRFGPPRHSNILISNVDILPTIAEIVGCQNNLNVDGESVLKLIKYFDNWFPLKKKRILLSEYIYTTQYEKLKSNNDPLEDNSSNILIRSLIEYTNTLKVVKAVYKLIHNENPKRTRILLNNKGILNHFFQEHDNELYRIDLDPEERKNLINDAYRVSTHIRKMSPLKDAYPEFYRSEEEISVEEIQRLKSLGYMQ